MKPSSKPQEPISLCFEVPKDYDFKGTTEVDIHLLVASTSDKPVVNMPVNLRVQYDSKDNGHEIGGLFETKYASLIVEEPIIVQGNSRLKHYRVTVELDSLKFYPQDLALIVFDRGHDANVANDEYKGDVYLAGASFRYKRNVPGN